MRVYRNIKYGEYEKNILDIYSPEIQNFKTIVYFHGGGLDSGNKSDSNYAEIAKTFVENGYCFVSVEYRMYPEAKFPDYLSDAAKSIKFIYDNIEKYGGNKQIIVSGQSAGAWISLMLCLDRKYLEREGLSNGDISGWIIDSAQTTAHFNVIRFELGEDRRKQMINEYAPLNFVDKDTAFSRMLLIYYENDMPCRPEQNLLFFKAIKTFNESADIKLVKLSGGHCNGSIRKNTEGKYDYAEESLKWLKDD